MEDQQHKPRTVCCIGDIHGHITKLQNLWSNLQAQINPPDFESALIIFLGDYGDRGYSTPAVLDFLISLPSKYPEQTHVFLSGNHDLAFAGFVGALPAPADGSEFRETWSEYEANEEREGWYKEVEYERMHVQARRWAGKMRGFDPVKKIEYMGSIYDAGPTFEAYGVPHGSPDLIKAVPAEHKKFLADMVWVHEEDNVCIETHDGIKQCKLIAVHAGLEKKRGVEEQLTYLRARDTKIPKVEALSGRKNVWDMPEDVAESSTIVTHVFLCGNHDLAFAAFLGVLPAPADGSKFSDMWSEYEANEEREGWYKGNGYERMHVQDRRWAGKMSGFNPAKNTDFKGSLYDAAPTFESYGVPHGSADLIKAVQAEHKKFLADLV